MGAEMAGHGHIVNFGMNMAVRHDTQAFCISGTAHILVFEILRFLETAAP